MRVALGEYQVGGIKTNIPLHLKILQDPDFLAGNIHTRYLDKFLSRPPVSTANSDTRSVALNA
jgi:biotin carboxylase